MSVNVQNADGLMSVSSCFNFCLDLLCSGTEKCKKGNMLKLVRTLELVRER